ncbi:acyl-CoA synthetase FdrA [Carnobacterium sp. TMP28]|uniref:acyl-CoA synthetase FdrA n=1 Tax=Carnobacterium sp. TMP28 TaxID=3397060 RepID=UPI0039DFE1B3
MVVYNKVNENAYYDSVTLMVISSKISVVEGVRHAAVMMGTDHNKEIMKGSNILSEEGQKASASDMIIGLEADNEDVIKEVLAVVDEELQSKTTSDDDVKTKFRTIDMAAKRIGQLNLAVISVPGKYAKNEAMKALNNDLNVLMFSDNVSIEEEVELKEKALEKGLLMMGPDCGTAILNGVALGFANKVSKGKIGIVGASGTGIQEVTTIIDKNNSGITQALGTGGRDLKEAVGGKMMLMELEALKMDSATEVILIVSKPPSEIIMKKIIAAIKDIDKPVVTCFLGGDPSLVDESGALAMETLEDAAHAAVDLANGKEVSKITFTIPTSQVDEYVRKEKEQLKDSQTYIRGLFSGGTLCYESILIMKKKEFNTYSNVALEGKYVLENPDVSKENTMLDMGEDYFTEGLPHPMLDTRLRVARIKEEAKDEKVAVLLLDLVLGYGVHEDPAGDIAPAVKEAKRIAEQNGRYLSVVASICGTDKDPQNIEEQEEKLKEAGIIVMPSNAQATRLASLILEK